MRVARGRAIEANGDGREMAARRSTPAARAADSGRVGIGTNPAANLSGNILEDEKVICTAHLAFGTNESFGGTNTSTVHIDGILLEPTVELDGRRLMHEGKLIL